MGRKIKKSPYRFGRAFLLLFLEAVDAERHGGQFVVEHGVLLVALDDGLTLLGCDELRTADAVLVVHAVVAESLRIDDAVTLHARQVKGNGLRVEGGVDHLDL